MQDLNITLLQADLVWENAPLNLQRFDAKIEALKTPADLILLPEMFSTGFSMQVERCAEPPEGPTMQWMKEKARVNHCVVAGSLLIRQEERWFNRFVWMQPDGLYEFYDKRHLFSMAGEHKTMSAGESRKIVVLKGWKINLQVCYDLRFPVWSKNTFDDGQYAFDVLIYVANWPEIRKLAYQRLLPARAIENQAFVVWVNRVGKDGKNVDHSGDSGVYDPLGNLMVVADGGAEQALQATLPAEGLLKQRSEFRIGPDWDSFSVDR